LATRFCHRILRLAPRTGQGFTVRSSTSEAALACTTPYCAAFRNSVNDTCADEGRGTRLTALARI
jgi:hypothetical protein